MTRRENKVLPYLIPPNRILIYAKVHKIIDVYTFLYV